MAFAHLHSCVYYSWFDGSISTMSDPYEKALELGLSGLTITDPSWMIGAPEFPSSAQQYPEIKPIVGCEFKSDFFILLAKNLTGYQNLIKLCSLAKMYRQTFQHGMSLQILEKYHDGLICLCEGLRSKVSKAILTSGIEDARKIAKEYKEVFGDDLYFEIYFIYPESKVDKMLASELSKLGQELGIKLVATNPTELISEEEMRTLFAEYPEAVDNTMEVLDKIDRYDIFRKFVP